MRIRAVVLMCAVMCAGGYGQVLDQVCLSESFDSLMEAGSLLPSDGTIAVDSVVYDGGDCDSVAVSAYISGFPYPLPMSIVKANACSLHVVVASGMVDTMLNACELAVRPAVAASALGAQVLPDGVVRALSTGGTLPKGVTVISVVRLNGSSVPVGEPSTADGHYLAHCLYAGRHWYGTFTRTTGRVQ